jgi:hypothetical protein
MSGYTTYTLGADDVGFLLEPASAWGLSNTAIRYLLDVKVDDDDPMKWGYWATPAGMFDPSTYSSGEYSTAVWIAGPKTPSSVVNDMINFSTTSYIYSGSVMGGVGSDPILMNDGINEIQLDINFYAQSANALIKFMTAGGVKWESMLSATSTSEFSISSAANNHKYKISVDNTGSNFVTPAGGTKTPANSPEKNLLQGHFYGNNAEYTGGTFQLDGGSFGAANGVFKAKRVQ